MLMCISASALVFPCFCYSGLGALLCGVTVVQ